MLTYEALELTVWTYPSLCKKKKGKCWKKKNTLENDSLFILKQVDLLTYILSQTKRSTQNTLRLKDPKFKVGDKD